MTRGLWISLAAAMAFLIAAAIPTVRYLRAGQEVLTLDDQARRHATGNFVRLPDGITHYQFEGPPGRTPVVLVSGFSTPYTIWDPTFDALTRAGFRVLRYDLFGRGYSDRPAGVYDAAFFDRQLLDLLDALGLRDPVDLFGLSMGGAISAGFVARHPGRVRRVVLQGPGYWADRPLPFRLRAPLLAAYTMAVDIAPTLPESQWDDFQHPERYPHYLEPYREQMRYRGFRRALLLTMQNYLSRDVTADFRALGRSGKPVLLIWGRADRDVPFDTSTEVRQAVPQAAFLPVDDAAHIPHYERPDVVNPAVIAFLR